MIASMVADTKQDAWAKNVYGNIMEMIPDNVPKPLGRHTLH